MPYARAAPTRATMWRMRMCTWVDDIKSCKLSPPSMIRRGNGMRK